MYEGLFTSVISEEGNLDAVPVTVALDQGSAYSCACLCYLWIC